MQKKTKASYGVCIYIYGINGIYGILWCHIYGIYMGLGPRNEDLHQLDEKLTHPWCRSLRGFQYVSGSEILWGSHHQS